MISGIIMDRLLTRRNSLARVAGTMILTAAGTISFGRYNRGRVALAPASKGLSVVCTAFLT